ncbi:MAG: hypothetical protein E6Q97_18890 [Desulfurellales bacterium]|nr:MAG: hypothetical protein E6Q97_18890 [Desulfurellales bacterium]
MVGGPVFGPQPRIKQALLVAAVVMIIAALCGLLLGCAAPRIEYRPVPAALIPPKPVLPTITADELACLRDATYLKLAGRDRMLRQYADELRALVEAR